MTAIAVLTAALLALVACNQTTPTAKGPTRKVIKGVVSLSPSTTEIYCGQTGCAGLVGRTSSCDYPPQVKTMGKVVVDGVTPNFQAITDLKPDLVIYDADLYGPQVAEKIKALGFQTLEFKVKSVDDLVNYQKQLSSILALEVNTSSSVDKTLQEMNNQLGVAKSAKTTPTLVIADFGGSVLAAGTKTFQADLYKRCGITLLGPDADKFAEWNAEELVKADPHAILTTEGGTAKLKGDPRFANLRAVKNDDVVEVNSSVLERVGSRIEDLIKATVPRIAKAANR